MQIVINILLAIHVLVSLLIILFVLMQRPKSEGLGAAFGGGMTDNLFGAQTTNALQTITRWLGSIFFALTLVLSLLYVKTTHKSSIQQRLSTAPAAPAAPPAPAEMDQKKLEEIIKKAVEEKKNSAAPADAQPAAPAADAKPAAEKLATPEKAPGKPPEPGPAK